MRVGIIGAGGISREHKRGYDQLEGVEFVGVADPSAQSRQCAEQDWGVTAYETAAELIEKAKPDAVSICSPPKFHKDLAIECLKAGVAVLCEKPMARNAVEAAEMQKAAVDSGTPLMMAFCHRFHPPVMKVKEAIENGDLGKILMFRNRFGGKQDMSQRWFGDPDLAGGGEMMDTSVHSVDLFRFLVGDAKWVTGAAADLAGIYKVEDSGIMVVGAVNGALAVIEGSWSTPASQNTVEIYGYEGAATVNYNTGQTQILRKGSHEWENIETDGPDRFVREVAAFVNAVKTKTAPPITGADGLAASLILDAAYKSSKEGVRVEL
ncbi:MAG TPA: Gfo/Idh/MocA family oxidoreductase [Armatimonadota bacterium]|jgi:predicted dehydrogenase